jgi:hypothetical protein
MSFLLQIMPEFWELFILPCATCPIPDCYNLGFIKTEDLTCHTCNLDWTAQGSSDIKDNGGTADIPLESKRKALIPYHHTCVLLQVKNDSNRQKN